MEEVYCTLLLTDSYLPGVQVLAHSLRDGGATRKLAVLVTEKYLSEATMTELYRLYDYVLPVDRITNKSHGNLIMMDRLDLSSAFTKIHLWKMVQFSKIVYIDADVVALRAPDELFEVKDRFAACPDIGWPDCFNSGVMVLKPDLGTYYGLLNLAHRGISFDGADQGLLNEYFRDWHRLSFVYNVTPSGHYQYAPAYNHYRSNITMAQFIGSGKPWTIGRSVGNENPSTPYGELLGRWWATWDSHYRPLTEQDPALAWLAQNKAPSAPQPSIEEIQRPNLMPTEYDPNFRREHESFDDRSGEQAAVWQPPMTLQQVSEVRASAPQPPPSPPHTYQPQNQQYHDEHHHHQQHHHEHQQQHHHHENPPPPIFLPKEHVPYVPREIAYTAYSQTQLPSHIYHEAKHHHHQEEQHHPIPPAQHQQHHQEWQHHPPPAQHQQQQQQQHHEDSHILHAPQPVHQQWQDQGRRFSQEISNRIDNSLPLPPMASQHSQEDPPKPEPVPFEPPMQSWNAERFSPPPYSKPEASNWPTQNYENQWDQQRQDTALFIPPKIASPPSNLHYQLPAKISPPPRPAPIFPWEQRSVPRPTRVFADDEPDADDPTTDAIVQPEAVEDEYETEEAKGGLDDPETESWQDYTRRNAWDSIPAIERYVASFQRQQRNPVRRGDVTPNPQWRSADQNGTRDVEGETFTSTKVLPPEISVTPTPFKAMRGYRSSAMDDESKFPSAKGIPDQQNWNPLRQLEELKNAPRELLNKRSPPSPPDLQFGSPRSPASLLVSSSMPVPEKEFHITAYQRRHEQSISSGNSSLTSSPLGLRHDTEKNDVPWRPVPRRYSNTATQTDVVETSDAETQSDPEDIDTAV